MYSKLILATALLIGAVVLWGNGFWIWSILSWGVSVFLLVGASDGGGYV
jgi:hypothetical protein